jgi:hypothetical protein
MSSTKCIDDFDKCLRLTGETTAPLANLKPKDMRDRGDL